MSKGRFFKRFMYKLVECNGYLDMEKGLAYSYDEEGKVWVSTDIYTGLKAYGGKTRKEAIERTEERYQVICDRRKTTDYNTFKNQFEMILNGKFGEVVRIED